MDSRSVEFGLAAQLHDAFGQLVGVFRFLVGVLEEFLGGDMGFNTVGHEIVTFVAQHADQLSGQRFVEQAQDFLAIGIVAFGHGAVFDVLAGALTQGAYVG